MRNQLLLLCAVVASTYLQPVYSIDIGVPATLRTAKNGTSVATAAKNTVFMCPRSVPMADGTTTTLPTTLLIPNSTWVTGDIINISEIPTVPGSVQMKSEFAMTTTDTHRRLKGNGIPNHPIGVFPIVNGSEAYAIYATLPAEGYANAAEIPVKPYDLDVVLPLNPTANAEPTCIDGLMLGVATQTGAAWHIEYAVDGNIQAVDPNAALPTDLCWVRAFPFLFPPPFCRRRRTPHPAMLLPRFRRDILTRQSTTTTVTPGSVSLTKALRVNTRRSLGTRWTGLASLGLVAWTAPRSPTTTWTSVTVTATPSCGMARRWTCSTTM